VQVPRLVTVNDILSYPWGFEFRRRPRDGRFEVDGAPNSESSPTVIGMRSLLLRLLVSVAAAVPALPLSAAAQYFAQPTVIPTGNWPAAVYTADVNGDGIPDLIYIDQGATAAASTTHILLGAGNGKFTQSATIATAGTSLAIGTFRIPGIPAILWATNTASGFSVYAAQGNGDGTFNSPYPVAGLATAGPKPPQIGYLGTGRLLGPITGAVAFSPEVFAEDTANNLLYVFLTNPDGTLVACYGTLPGGPGPLVFVPYTVQSGLTLGTVIVDGQSSGTAQVFNTLPSLVPGAFPPSPPNQQFTGVSGIRSLLAQQVNNSATPELFAEGVNGHIDIFPGNGDGTFQSTSIGGSGTLNGATGNGGHLIAIANRQLDRELYALTSTPIGISTLLGSTSGIWTLNGIYNAGPGRTAYAVADFNRDGNLDLAVDSPEGIAILFGDADGSFQTNRAFAAGQPAMSGLLGTFTASGNVDAVVSIGATQAQFLKGNGDGTFTFAGSPNAPVPTTNQSGPPGLWSTILPGNFTATSSAGITLTADGPAAAIPPAGIGFTIQDGNGDGTFQAPNQPQVTQVNSSCTGSLDMLFGNSAEDNFNGAALAQFVNRDRGSFRVEIANPANPAGPLNIHAFPDATCNQAHNLVATGMFHASYIGNPYRADILVQSGSSLLLYLNDGSGNFSQPLGDLSVDGSLTTPGQLTAPILSPTFNGPAIPTSSGGLGFPAFPGSIAVADLDGDGNEDLVVTYANLAANLQAPTSAAPNYIYIWFGSGGGKFLTSAKHPVNPVRLTPSRNFYQVVVARTRPYSSSLDLILSDGYIVSVQLGNGDGTFGPETHYLAGQGINTISAQRLRGFSGPPDLVLANGGAVLTNPVANLETLASNPDVNTGGVTVLLNVPVIPTLQAVSGTVSATPEPSTYSSLFNLTATIDPPAGYSVAPTGTVSFAIDGNSFGSANLINLSATIAVPSYIYSTLALGAHSITATYSGDSNYTPNSFNGTHNVALIPTSINLLLCVDPPGSNFPCGNPLTSTPLISPITMFYGQSVDGVAEESANNLTGTITFYSNATPFCVLNANLSMGSNICPPTSGFFPAGTTTVTVVYSGDSTHAPCTSNAIVVTVYQDTATAGVASSLNPATVGQQVAFTAAVAGNFAIPAGDSVIFLDGTTTLATVSLDATGHATYATSSLPVGTHPITVALPGSASFTSVTSPVLNQLIQPLQSAVLSVISLTSSLNPSAPAQPVTFTATVTIPGPFAFIPTGTVTFLDGATAIGSATLNSSGIATFTTTSLATGSHAITASYGGAPQGGTGLPIKPPNPPKPINPAFEPPIPASPGFRISGPVAHELTLPAPVLLSPRLQQWDQNVTTAGASAPEERSLPSSPASNTSQPPYPQATTGTPPILASVSPVLTQIVTTSLGVEASGFILTVTPVPVSVGVGRTAILLVTVRDASGFNQPVQLSCSGLPTESACSFVQSLIPAGGGLTTLYLSTAAPHACGTTTPYFLGSVTPTGRAAILLACLAMLPLYRRPRLRNRMLTRAILLSIVALCGLAALSGCGNCTDLGTRPAVYTFTVTAAAQGANAAVQSQAIQLTVTIP